MSVAESIAVLQTAWANEQIDTTSEEEDEKKRPGFCDRLLWQLKKRIPESISFNPTLINNHYSTLTLNINNTTSEWF